MAFELFQNKDTKEYYFRLKAKNNQIILQSEGYESKAGAKNGIESVIANAAAGSFEKKKAKDGRGFFVLKAKNGEVIGKSQMYKSTGGLNNGIKSVTTNAVEGIKEIEA